MKFNDIKLLDCTLRDGGYINNWTWGFQKAKNIIEALVHAHTDFIEVGFLRDVVDYNPDVTVCNYIEELNKLLPKSIENTVFSAMAMRSNYDIKKLNPYSGTGIEMVRITAHDYDIEEGLDYAYEIKEKGYKVSVNPINIMGYSDDQILWLIELTNKIKPYQFTIVDTFGSMKHRDLNRITSLVDHNLNSNIRVALHLHENMALSYSLAQRYIDQSMNRSIVIDGSLMGIGRTPGNLPIELIADYLNDYFEGGYDMNYLLDAIYDYIEPLKGESKWGYMPSYFLSAKFNIHRNYAEHYLGKGDLTTKDINCILSQFDHTKATVFDMKYADSLYENYKNHRINDSEDRKRLMHELKDKNVLILAPGSTIKTYNARIKDYIAKHNVIVFSLNFYPIEYEVNYCFISNNKRFDSIGKPKNGLILTSNITNQNADYQIDYNSISGSSKHECNSLIMLLKLLRDLQVCSVTLAGADGYIEDGVNYYDSSIRSYSKHGAEYNYSVSKAIQAMNMKIEFLTPSMYHVD